ncbi:MAG TPA: DUF362 domain-containing protein [Xanthobacteraceae bacterium]|nr:DUF362 domain-containing protein [Xanthobacteraceae bacterium]
MRPSASEQWALGPRVSRRQFVAALSGPLLAAAACSRRPFDARDFSLLEKSPVALLPAASYDVDFAELIGRGLQELRLDLRGRRVLLKPNMVEYESGRAINTSPFIVGGAAVAMRRAGASEVVIAEGPGHRRDTEYLITRTGLYDHLRDLRIRFVDLNLDDVREVPLRSRFMGLERLALPVELLRADFIVSMPKLKTHHWAGMTASMKNFFGVVPGAVYGWPKNVLHTHGIDNSIVDLNATIRPHLSIVDAVTAMEGDGPIMGKARHLGFVGMGTDLPAVDATCARVIGLEPSKLPYLKSAGDFLGNIELARIEQRGEPLARYATTFEIPERFQASRLSQA